MTWSQIITLIGAHPGEAVALVILLLMASFIGAGVFLMAAERRERDRRASERQRLNRIIQANAPPVEWPRSRGPHGFRRRSGGDAA